MKAPKKGWDAIDAPIRQLMRDLLVSELARKLVRAERMIRKAEVAEERASRLQWDKPGIYTAARCLSRTALEHRDRISRAYEAAQRLRTW